MSITNICLIESNSFQNFIFAKCIDPKCVVLRYFINYQNQNFFALPFVLGDDEASGSNYRCMVNYILS